MQREVDTRKNMISDNTNLMTIISSFSEIEIVCTVLNTDCIKWLNMTLFNCYYNNLIDYVLLLISKISFMK